MIYKKHIIKAINILLPFVLGGGILYWMYREFDFTRLEDKVMHEMNWGWMMFSMIFGIAAQVFRGIRWRQSLEPLGEKPRTIDCIHAVFISYATSIFIPRSGEFTRCGILAKYNSTNFTKALGTVVSERIIDSLLIMLFALLVLVFQLNIFNLFLDATSTNLTDMLHGFTTMGYIVTAICLVTTLVFFYIIMRRFAFMTQIKRVVNNMREGIMSLSGVRNKWLFAFYSIMIWVSYFLQYWVTFYCFGFTSDLSIMVALVSFIVGSFAVIVPTPNGAGAWHFAVKTILILYGVESTNAETFVLVVHTFQTPLMPLLGAFSMFCLTFRKEKT